MCLPFLISGMMAKVAAIMRITQNGIDLIKRFEGFRATAYLCPAKVLTIGYGHTSRAGAPPVTRGMKIGEAEAAVILRRDVESFAKGVAKLLTIPLNDNQFSALVSFAYNVGLGAFAKSSVLKAVNSQDFAAVPGRLKLWTKGGGKVLPGLVKRRAAEAQLFATPVST